MTAVIPVETILKVEDEPLRTGNEKFSENASSETPVFISVGIQCSPVEPEPKQHENYALLCNNSDKCIGAMSKSGSESQHVFMKPLPLQLEPNTCHNPKMVMSNGFSKPYSCNFQPFPFDDDIFLQLDYKTRNKLKTKQRRQDPCYRDQERMRQRAVMQLKRQDPCFRAIEREKGRCRMRIKRLDPVFRSQERERQRERMKLKRQDPDFRERERELQKSRIHEKRLNLDLHDKEKSRDHVCLHFKHNHDSTQLHVFTHLEQRKLGINSTNVHALEPFYIPAEVTKEDQNIRNASCSSNPPSDVKPIILKDGDNTINTCNTRIPHLLNCLTYSGNTVACLSSAEKLSKATVPCNRSKDSIHQQSILNNCDGFSTKAHDDYVRCESKTLVNNNPVSSPEINKQQLCIGTDTSSSTETSSKISKRQMSSS